MQWEPDHDYFDGRRGKELRQTRYWGALQMGWSVLTRRQYIYIAQALRAQDPLGVVPATRHPERDAPGATERRYEMEATSALPLVGASNVPGGYYSISVSLRTTSWVPERPSLEPAEAWAPDFGEHVDLFGGLQQQTLTSGAQGWKERMGAYAGRLLRLEARGTGEHVVRLYDAAGAQIGTGVTGTLLKGEGLYVDLLAGVHALEVEAPVRPRATLDRDTFALQLTQQADGSHRLRAIGRGQFEAQGPGLTFRGTGYGTRWRLTPAALGQQRLRQAGRTLSITHDT